jgi:hypothetical protein
MQCFARPLLVAAGVLVLGTPWCRGQGISPRFDLDARVKDGKVELRLKYGRNITGLVKLLVKDKDGKPLWTVAASGQTPIRKITYGEAPVDPCYKGEPQEYPPDDKQPKDIRGKEVQIQVRYRFNSLLGPGVEIYDKTIIVPKK